MTALIAIAFIMGLSSSLHCIGMCGPIALILPIQNQAPTQKIIKTLIYHLGRVLTYAILGAIIGLAGRSFQIMGVLQYISIGFGALIIVGVIFPKILNKIQFFNRIYLKLQSALNSAFGQAIKQKSSTGLFILGVINGLLPCGAVYFALIGSLVYGSIEQGALFMTFFGLGTLPAMALVTYYAQSLSSSIRLKFKKIAPVVLVLFGGLFIVRGMNLDIPYISPKVELNQAGEEEVSCCSKKGTEECVSKKKKSRKSQTEKTMN